MNENYGIGRWELGCIIFNSLIYKLFSLYPKVYFYFGGCASWLTALFSGFIFLVGVWIIVVLYEKSADVGLVETLKKKFGIQAGNFLSLIAVVYFIISFCFALFYVCCTLRETVFPTSPLWYTGFFIVLAALTATLCGKQAVVRMHSLCTLGIGGAIVLIFLCGLKYADIYNLTPVLGKGASGIFLKGLSSLYMYSDILIIFFLPKRSGRYSYKKTVLISSFLAVIANVLVMLSFSLNFPYEYAGDVDFIVYSLTKGAGVGKFPIRLDFAYLLALVTSAILYCSAALAVIFKETKNIKFSIKRTGFAVLSILICLTLCGCYDSSEVEEKGYVIALGIDKEDDSGYVYTFQLSNPLESGGSMGTEEKADENSTQDDNENKTVDNICVKANDFFTAQNKLKSILSKKVDLSSVKAVVISKQAAKDDALKHCRILLNEMEVRPSVNLCIAESAAEFLKSVNPTLEENTIRYYELFFRNRDVPYATVVTLRDFVSKSVEKGVDAVMPCVNEDGLSGMALFISGKMCDILDEDETFIYNILSGNAENAGFNYTDGECTLSSEGKPNIDVSTDNLNPYINMTINIKVSDNADSDKVAQVLKNKSERLLYKTAVDRCDIFGFGKNVKAGFTTQNEWESYKWDVLYKNSVFSVNVFTNNGKYY